jgi:hypothetical protein
MYVFINGGNCNKDKTAFRNFVYRQQSGEFFKTLTVVYIAISKKQVTDLPPELSSLCDAVISNKLISSPARFAVLKVLFSFYLLILFILSMIHAVLKL